MFVVVAINGLVQIVAAGSAVRVRFAVRQNRCTALRIYPQHAEPLWNLSKILFDQHSQV